MVKFKDKLVIRALTMGIKKIKKKSWGWDLEQLFHTKLVTMTSSFSNVGKGFALKSWNVIS